MRAGSAVPDSAGLSRLQDTLDAEHVHPYLGPSPSLGFLLSSPRRSRQSKAPNRLSVGELLVEGDLSARRVLLDPDDLDAAAMVRTCQRSSKAGHEFLAILPHRSGGGPEVHALPAPRSHSDR